MEVESEQVESEDEVEADDESESESESESSSESESDSGSEYVDESQKFLRSRTKGEPFGMFVDHLL